MTFKTDFRRADIEPWKWWITRHDLKFFLSVLLLVVLL